MTTLIWQKNQQITIDQTIMDYLAGEDILLDQQLIHYDIIASQAHVTALADIQIISQAEGQQLCDQLHELQTQINQGQYHLDTAFEDCHSAIEAYLVEKLGDLGKKVHTGRSRNDQILVASRLYLKDSMTSAITYCQQAASASLTQAEQTQHIPMPGYTHMQRAVPSSCGMWFAGFAEAMIDNLQQLQATQSLIDSNPLGTAAGYGVNLPLNRELTTQVLGFSRQQINPIYCQNSRGKYELAVLNSLGQCLLDIRRYCWDLSLFSTQEFNFVSLPDEMTTGSSIMPNKRNPDLVELMRAAYATVHGATTELQSMLSLPSGYQRDLQLSKGPVLRATHKALQTMLLFPKLINGTEFNIQRLTAAIDTPMYATDFAVELSAQGMPFRDAYQQVVERYDQLTSRTANGSLAQRISPGGCANLCLSQLTDRLQQLST